MAVDTRDKRGSAVGAGLPFALVYPTPDGSVGSVADRQQTVRLYSGILAGLQDYYLTIGKIDTTPLLVATVSSDLSLIGNVVVEPR